MGYSLRKEAPPAERAVLDIVEHLWHTKRLTVRLMEQWLQQTEDGEIKAGLTSQLVDERRQHRAISEQLMRLAGRLPGKNPPEGLGRIFDEIEAETNDLLRICALYRGVKAFTVDRCSHLLPLVDPRLAGALALIAQEDERHIRWADIRMERLLTYERMRAANLLMGRMRRLLEAAWERQWVAVSSGAIRGSA